MADLSDQMQSLDLNASQGSRRTNRSRARGRRDLHAYALLTPQYQAAPAGFDPNAAASSAGFLPPGTPSAPGFSRPTTPYDPYIQPQVAQSTSQLSQLYGTQPATPYGQTFSQPPTPGINRFASRPTTPAVSQFTPTVPQFTPSSPPQFPQPTHNDLSVPVVRAAADQVYRETPFKTFENVYPPLSGSQYAVQDQGNASPKFVRMSLYNVPASRQVFEATSLPLGLILRPFEGTEVPEADFTNASSVPRCRRCRAYVNPAMRHNGYQMTCNLCGFTTPVPTDYTSPLDSKGFRSDYYQRPELHAGVYDLKVPKEYWQDEAVAPEVLHHVFVVDLSQPAVQEGLVAAACEAIGVAIEALAQNGDSEEGEKLEQSSKSSRAPSAQICILGFDSSLHFFNLSSSLQQVSVSVVSDLFDPFVPLADAAGIFADPAQSAAIIQATLQTLESTTAQPVAQNKTTCFGSALQAADLLLEPHGGGQVTAFLSAAPAVGPGILRPKIARGRAPEDYARDVLRADSPFYSALTPKLVEHHVGVNLFVGSQMPVDLMTLAKLVAESGGVVRLFPHFSLDGDELDLVQAVKHSVVSTAGYQAQLKVRCSGGLQVSHLYWGMHADDTTLAASGAAAATPDFSIVGPHTSVACDFVYDGTLSTAKDAHFQSAILYTGSDGIRRVRVVNSIVSVTERVADVFAFADQDAVLSLMLRSSLARLPDATIVTVRNVLVAALSKIVSRYAALVAKNNSLPGQLVLPRGLHVLPMLLLGALKSRALVASNFEPDARVVSYLDLATLPTDLVGLAVYPHMYALNRLDEDECAFAGSFFSLPQAVPLSQSQLVAGGAFLLFDGRSMLLWLHSDVSVQFLHDLFGEAVNSLDDLDPRVTLLPPLETKLSKQVRDLVRFLSWHFLGWETHSVKICRFRLDANEALFLAKMHEDQGPEKIWSYADLLRNIQKRVETTKAETPREGTFRKWF